MGSFSETNKHFESSEALLKEKKNSEMRQIRSLKNFLFFLIWNKI